jgi:uncharacterized iron-regulated membrane protein
MYPESFLWWLGGTLVLFGIVGLIGLLALAVDRWYQRHIEKHHGAPKRDDDEGRTRLWYVFEVLSAILVVTSLLMAIYSDSQLLRAVAGIALIVIVSAATAAVVSPDP